ncbi:hypothetical protein D3C79_960730 [compost metagenome]
MHYEDIANVTIDDVIRAQIDILRLETPQAVIESLAQRPFWQRYVRDYYSERHGALVAPFQERLVEAEAAVEGAGNMSEGDYLARADAMRLEYLAAERELMRKIAEEAWQRHQS